MDDLDSQGNPDLIRVSLAWTILLMCNKPLTKKPCREVKLNQQPVELYKILKFEGLVPSGGIAKLAIEAGEVMVNGEVERRKRKKMLAGDIIEFNAERLHLLSD